MDIELAIYMDSCEMMWSGQGGFPEIEWLCISQKQELICYFSNKINFNILTFILN